MAPSKKAKTMMALDYEQRRLENIRRNQQMIAAILHKKSQLSPPLLSPRKPSKPKRPYRKHDPPATLRRSLRARGIPPSDSPPVAAGVGFGAVKDAAPAGKFSFADVWVGSGRHRPLVEAACWPEEGGGFGDGKKEVRLDVGVELGLREDNVAKVAGERITAVRFLPVPTRSIILAGNKQGYLGIWDADRCGEDGEGDPDPDGVFMFYPHRSAVSGISVHPSSVRKIYSSCYDGDLCLMDIEKEMFDIIHSSDDSIFSIFQSLHDHNSLFLGERGKVKSFDQRTGEISNEWELHELRVNSIDVHPENTNLIATSSSDAFVRIWDLRYIRKDKPKSIKEVAHSRAVNSAYFSPTGNGIASTSFDDTVRISSGPQFENLSIIKHHNQTGRWLSSFRAIWGWDDSYIFIGNMKRAVDVISTEDNFTTSLISEYMTNIPCRFATHPYEEGRLACAGGGKLYLWTKL